MTGGTGRLGRLLRSQWAGGCWPGRPEAQDWPGFDLAPGGVVLHLAGVTRGPAPALAANVDLAQRVGQAARRAGAARVLFASTVAVYRPRPQPLDEADPPDPQADYGRSKWQAEQALAQALAGSGTALTILRIANVAGADALLGGALARPGQEVVLDPVPGQPDGPERSYIGPLTLARVLSVLLAHPAPLPAVLNLAQPGVVAMADLLQAARLPWRWGEPRPGVLPRVQVSTTRLAALVPLDPATPAGLLSELDRLRGIWP